MKRRVHKSSITEVPGIVSGTVFKLYYVLENNRTASGFTHHRAQFISHKGAEKYLASVVA